jgi:hypothetical protein
VKIPYSIPLANPVYLLRGTPISVRDPEIIQSKPGAAVITQRYTRDLLPDPFYTWLEARKNTATSGGRST